MQKNGYDSMHDALSLNRRDFVKIGIGAGLVLGNPAVWAKHATQSKKSERIKTNIEDATSVPRTVTSIPGPFPGRVIHVKDMNSIHESKVNKDVVQSMFQKGMENLTGKNLQDSFNSLLSKDDVVGIKVNPVGGPIISTRLEVVDVLIEWLVDSGLPQSNVIIWDRFDYMLTDAGFTADRYPGIGIEGLQTMDESAQSGETDDNSRWLKEDGTHVSAANFDQSVYYWADVEGPKDLPYLNQHVFNGKQSYFGKLLTQKLTKIINVPVFKNTGNGVSMATKNIGYGAVCNTNRLHKPLFFDVNTEVMAFPPVRDKLILNITDGLQGQYDGGPMAAAQFIYPNHSLYFATDPFALDMICHQQIVQKRKEMKVKVNEHPMYTEYLRYAERLGLGVVDKEKMQYIQV